MRKRDKRIVDGSRSTYISINTYAERFDLKGKIYHEVIKMYCTPQEIEAYIILRKKYKGMIGKERTEKSFSVLNLLI